MTNIERLQQWYETQRRDHGLVDLKIFPGADTNVPPEEVAGVILDIVEGRAHCEPIDPKTL